MGLLDSKNIGLKEGQPQTSIIGPTFNPHLMANGEEERPDPGSRGLGRLLGRVVSHRSMAELKAREERPRTTLVGASKLMNCTHNKAM